MARTVGWAYILFRLPVNECFFHKKSETWLFERIVQKRIEEEKGGLYIR